jgi:SET domain-containing protein
MKGWSVQAGQNIKIGEFISEYVGEIISLSEARRREVVYRTRKNGNYMLIFREWLTSYNKILCTAIDATNLGNISRFYNHSCDPNIGVFAVRVDNILPRVSFFALRNIEKGEELCFSYSSLKGEVNNSDEPLKETDMVRCYCGAMNCVTFLPNDTF